MLEQVRIRAGIFLLAFLLLAPAAFAQTQTRPPYMDQGTTEADDWKPRQ
jgi:hypothetical protein